jgi:hypothetical protein
MRSARVLVRARAYAVRTYEHTSAYVGIRRHTSAYIMRAYAVRTYESLLLTHADACRRMPTYADVC